MKCSDSGRISFLGPLLALSALAVLAGCGAPATTAAGASPTSTASPTSDVAGARKAALTIFYAIPGQTPQVWVPCSQAAADFAACPFSAAVKARLSELSRSYYFSSGGSGTCGEEYITGTQNGLNNEPRVLSSVANARGSVTVVIHRGSPPDFTVTMTQEGGQWLALDLASGSGPNASVFSTKPNC
jgi:hypothetical protein